MDVFSSDTGRESIYRVSLRAQPLFVRPDRGRGEVVRDGCLLATEIALFFAIRDTSVLLHRF